MKCLKKGSKDNITYKVCIGSIKKNYKLVLLTSFITSIITILLFSFIIYYAYSHIRIKECLNNNTALYSFVSGNLKLAEEGLNIKVYTGDGYTVRLLDSELHIVSDSVTGYTKIYKNNILQSIKVYNPLDDVASYLNPKFWITGSRTIRSEKMYYIRQEEEIRTLNNAINNYGEDYLISSHLDYLPYQNSYIILK